MFASWRERRWKWRREGEWPQSLQTTSPNEIISLLHVFDHAPPFRSVCISSTFNLFPFEFPLTHSIHLGLSLPLPLVSIALLQLYFVTCPYHDDLRSRSFLDNSVIPIVLLLLSFLILCWFNEWSRHFYFSHIHFRPHQHSGFHYHFKPTFILLSHISIYFAFDGKSPCLVLHSLSSLILNTSTLFNISHWSLTCILSSQNFTY